MRKQLVDTTTESKAFDLCPWASVCIKQQSDEPEYDEQGSIIYTWACFESHEDAKIYLNQL